jgi:hypothetical protein
MKENRRRHPRRQEHQPALRRRQGADRHQLQRARARDPRHHRPQRRRQELDAQLHQRRLHAAGGQHHLPRQDLQPHEQPPGGRDGHRAHLPEPGAVQGHERARQHHDRAQPEDEEQPLPAGAALGPAEREEIEHREKVEEIIDFLEIQAFRKTPVGRCPTACRSASTWAARWPWSRRCCCSTSRWPA